MDSREQDAHNRLDVAFRSLREHRARIEKLEDTDRIAISGGKECDRRYVEARNRIEHLEARAADLEEKPGPDFGPALRRIEALEKALQLHASAVARELARHNVESLHPKPAWDAVREMYPTCGTCRWFKQDDPSLLFDPKRTGMCRAHPCVWAKTAEMACGEHAPRE